jgi:hypothetical protein
VSNTLTHSTRRFLMDRLDRLHDALEGLGKRLREGIAQLVGSHIGDAVKDALAVLLLRNAPAPDPEPYYRRESSYRPHDPYHDDYERGFWNEREPMPRERDPEPEPEREQKPSRWKTMLTGLVQVSTWWLQRYSWRSYVIAGAAVSAATLIASPVVGGVLALVGTAALLTRLIARAAHAADRATHLVTP